MKLTTQKVSDLFQPKAFTFSTRTLIWVHFKNVYELSQPIFSSFSHLKNALHNSVIELCNALKTFQNILRLFIKLTHSFVAIELLTFWKKAKNYFIAQESSWYSVRKQDWIFLLFVYFKNVPKKIGFFVYEWKLQWLPAPKYNAHVFIYKKLDTFQKARQFLLRFYIEKAIHFTLPDFPWNFWS